MNQYSYSCKKPSQCVVVDRMLADVYKQLQRISKTNLNILPIQIHKHSVITKCAVNQAWFPHRNLTVTSGN